MGKRLPGAAPRVSSQHQQGEVNQISLAVTSRTAHQLFSDTFSQLPANSLSCCHFFSVVRGADDVLICVICSHPGLKKDGSSRNHGLLSFIHLSTHPSIHPPIHPSIHPSIHLLTFLSAPFTYLSPFHLLIHPSIHTFTHQPTYPSTHPHTHHPFVPAFAQPMFIERLPCVSHSQNIMAEQDRPDSPRVHNLAEINQINNGIIASCL